MRNKYKQQNRMDSELLTSLIHLMKTLVSMWKTARMGAGGGESIVWKGNPPP